MEENSLNFFQQIITAAWSLMCTEFSIYGFTLSYGKVFLFSLFTSLVVVAVFRYLWG